MLLERVELLPTTERDERWQFKGVAWSPAEGRARDRAPPRLADGGRRCAGCCRRRLRARDLVIATLDEGRDLTELQRVARDLIRRLTMG